MATTQQLYARLIKPTWAPPAWLFGPVWTTLYAIMLVSFGRVAQLFADGAISSWEAMPFALNLFFNLIFNYLQFGLQSNLLASIDIVLVWLTIIWCVSAIHEIEPWVAWAQLPYFLWVSFAMVLQLTITYLNWGQASSRYSYKWR